MEENPRYKIAPKGELYLALCNYANDVGGCLEDKSIEYLIRMIDEQIQRDIDKQIEKDKEINS